jgi:hypothetical protein
MFYNSGLQTIKKKNKINRIKASDCNVMTVPTVYLLNLNACKSFREKIKLILKF